MAFPMLFSPITIKGMTLKNRVVMTVGGCAASGGKEDGYTSATQADFLVRRARGGVGMMIIGVTGGDMPRQAFLLRLSQDKHLPSFQRVVERIQKPGLRSALNFSSDFKEGKIPPEDVPLEDMNGKKKQQPGQEP
jgi:2,4-dienoyl-CoA reductase-like NADH-dependent reductase (Old Yellow Enzyme family)